MATPRLLPKQLSSSAELKVWLTKGKDMGAKYMIVACDTWDYYDFVIFVSEEEEIKQKIDQLLMKHTFEIVAVYNLFQDIEPQLAADKPYFID